MTSVWAIGERAAGGTPHIGGPGMWDLVAFADTASLQRVHVRTHLHRREVRLRMVTAEDRFVLAWGELHGVGALSEWEWTQANDGEAFYSEVRWSGSAANGIVERTRRRALRLWPCGGFPEESYRSYSDGGAVGRRLQRADSRQQAAR